MSQDKYAQMQKDLYDSEATKWSLTNKDPVVGFFEGHQSWSDYDEYLFKSLDDTQNKIALDFGCGPGRNIVKFANRFQRIDGVDISSINLEKAKVWFEANNLTKESNLFMNNGIDISCCQLEYDVVFSTIAMQHICVYDTRFSLLSDFHRVLKPGGALCIQMGYGASIHKRTVHYNDNYYDAEGTNGFCDVRIDSPDQVKQDLEKIGFTNFSYDIRPVGPGDGHANWIFFRATKQG